MLKTSFLTRVENDWEGAAKRRENLGKNWGDETYSLTAFRAFNGRLYGTMEPTTD